jgi:HD-like signal output (HDOD) protein
MAAAALSTVPPTPRPARSLGRFELHQLLGRSGRTMVWRVRDPRVEQARALVMPRVQPQGTVALQQWLDHVRHASRLSHPRLAQAVDIGTHENWPYVAYDIGADATLFERLQPQGSAPADVARWMAQALDGLAFVHDAGLAHHDVQLHMVLLGAHGARVMGLAAGCPPPGENGDRERTGPGRTMSVDPQQLGRQRDAAERDVIGVGLALHHLLAGQPALDEPDIGAVIERLPPHGRDLVRLPWNIPRPVPEPLRVIVNRAADRQARQRYRSARTLARALEGWIEADAQNDGGPLAHLLDRVRRNGALPALPDAPVRAARLASMLHERTDELAELVLGDMALAFEILRTVNSAQVRGTQAAGNGPVLTVRRAIALIGVDGVRQAARALRPWPGPLAESAAEDLRGVMDHAARCGRVAQALRPAGYDGEVVYLLAVAQNLGRLALQYHFPDEAAQVRRLMQPAAAEKPGEREQPGMDEETAGLAVLGIGVEAMGLAVARHWGLDDTVLQMIRRVPRGTPVRAIERDEDLLRTVASAANEAVDAAMLSPGAATTAIDRVAQRYARPLGVSPKDLRGALAGIPVPVPTGHGS